MDTLCSISLNFSLQSKKSNSTVTLTQQDTLFGAKVWRKLLVGLYLGQSTITHGFGTLLQALIWTYNYRYTVKY